MKIIIGGGGTGGHIFSAISIADALKKRIPEIKILFVGSNKRMEKQCVSTAGYRIIGLPVSGFNRKNLLKNILTLYRLLRSFFLARKLINNFQPDIAIGVGGYASGPILQAAAQKKIPILIQEQNSIAGITNRLLAKKAVRICVAFPEMERFFSQKKISITGNPVRQDLIISEGKKQEGYAHFGLSSQKKTILILGGSLGSKRINESVLFCMKIIEQSKHIQWIWQSGQSFNSHPSFFPSNICFIKFISRMDLAYSIADLVISRAGAGSISELCLLSKPVILVPSPNVTEDHQTKNAKILVKINAALMVTDQEAKEKLIPKALEIIHDKSELKKLSKNIFKCAFPDAANKIVDEIMDVFQKTILSTPNLYFIGAGGIGMSSLVQYFLFYGKNVAGYDKTESTLTHQLSDYGAFIHYSDDVHLIPKSFKNKKKTKIVITPAIPCNHSEWTYFRKKGFKIIKRATLLGAIIQSKQGICIAGTHGKTTVSSMITHLLKQSKIGCNAFLGGILKDYQTNLLLSSNSKLTVVEADEYDRSFHWLSASTAVITAVDADHLDTYGTEKNYKEAFEHFTSLVRPGGILLIEEQVKITPRVKNKVKIYRYCGEISKNKHFLPDFYAQNVRVEKGEIYLDFVAPNIVIKNISLGSSILPIKINIANSIVALSVAWLHGVNQKELKQGLSFFHGVKRRFDFHIKTDNLVLIDDYAHHPKELEQSISSIRSLYPNRKITAIFQPHLYSRTFNFYQEFAQSLSLANEVFLLPIYPAREKSIPGVSSQMILNLVTVSLKMEIKYDKLIPFLSKRSNNDIILMLGAGDIELLIEPLKKALLSSTTPSSL